MEKGFEAIKREFSHGERFDEMNAYTDRKLKIWEKEVAALFPRGASILDIGCGKGREAFCLDEMGFRLTGIDISEAVVEAAQKIAQANQRDIAFAVSNGTDIPFPDAAFDGVIIWAQTFGLMGSAQGRERILLECRRVLKNGGILSFSGHDREYLQENYAQYLKGDVFHPFADSALRYRTFTLGELADCVKKAGFQLISCKKGSVYTERDGTILHCECRK